MGFFGALVIEALDELACERPRAISIQAALGPTEGGDHADWQDVWAEAARPDWL